MAYCTKCGKEVQEGDTFCHACGATVVRSGQAAAPAPPMPPGSAPVSPAAVPMPPAPPAQMTEEDEVRQRVERRLKDRMDLMYHIAAYVIVNTFLIIVWALSGSGYPWFIWTLAPWGVGLAFHIFAYFMGSKKDSAREHMVQKEMAKMQGQQAVSGETKAAEEEKS